MLPIRDKIKEIIIKDIPLNTTCNECERHLDRECLIDDSSHAQTDWNEMIDKIIGALADHVNSLKEY